ncbi:hypothetical protein KFK09_001293 [Dendrobium nobile]|uniref:Uncharacterized protein n=1 Tax=Dendrobium nobile TaxID=94219 RepID=A0A8T3C9X7_DENNO|nr:hypothetical protein KFK09_001293 [Dendrobium nobile]
MEVQKQSCCSCISSTSYFCQWIQCLSFKLLAGFGFFKAEIRGRQCSPGNPHNSIDPIVAVSAAVISLQNIVSRESNPIDSQRKASETEEGR